MGNAKAIQSNEGGSSVAKQHLPAVSDESKANPTRRERLKEKQGIGKEDPITTQQVKANLDAPELSSEERALITAAAQPGLVPTLINGNVAPSAEALKKVESDPNAGPQIPGARADCQPTERRVKQAFNSLMSNFVNRETGQPVSKDDLRKVSKELRPKTSKAEPKVRGAGVSLNGSASRSNTAASKHAQPLLAPKTSSQPAAVATPPPSSSTNVASPEDFYSHGSSAAANRFLETETQRLAQSLVTNRTYGLGGSIGNRFQILSQYLMMLYAEAMENRRNDQMATNEMYNVAIFSGIVDALIKEIHVEVERKESQINFANSMADLMKQKPSGDGNIKSEKVDDKTVDMKAPAAEVQEIGAQPHAGGAEGADGRLGMNVANLNAGPAGGRHGVGGNAANAGGNAANAGNAVNAGANAGNAVNAGANNAAGRAETAKATIKQMLRKAIQWTKEIDRDLLKEKDDDKAGVKATLLGKINRLLYGIRDDGLLSAADVKGLVENMRPMNYAARGGGGDIGGMISQLANWCLSGSAAQER
jgi:hypothetical protein